MRKASVSPCAEGSLCWTRRLRPEPRRVPSRVKMAAPIGMPPSARPRRASEMATASMASGFIRTGYKVQGAGDVYRSRFAGSVGGDREAIRVENAGDGGCGERIEIEQNDTAVAAL